MDEVKITERIAVTEQDLRSVHRRIDNLEKLTESVHVIATELKAMREDVSDIMTRVDEIERKPTKRYETIITSIITAVIGIIIGYFSKM